MRLTAHLQAKLFEKGSGALPEPFCEQKTYT